MFHTFSWHYGEKINKCNPNFLEKPSMCKNTCQPQIQESTAQWFFFLQNALYLRIFYITFLVCHTIHQEASVPFKMPFISKRLKYNSEYYHLNFSEVLREKYVRNGYVTSESILLRVLSLHSLGCAAHTSFGLQNICWIFLQNKCVMRLSHTSSCGRNTLKALFLKKNLHSLTAWVHEWHNPKVKKFFHSLTKSL